MSSKNSVKNRFKPHILGLVYVFRVIFCRQVLKTKKVFLIFQNFYDDIIAINKDDFCTKKISFVRTDCVVCQGFVMRLHRERFSFADLTGWVLNPKSTGATCLATPVKLTRRFVQPYR